VYVYEIPNETEPVE